MNLLYNVDRQYQELLLKVINNGKEKEDRTSTGTISTFSHTLEIDMAQGFPLLTTKKMFTRGIIHELLWFLNGDTNIQYLVRNGVNIWTPDAYREYKKSFEVHPTGNIDIDFMLKGHSDQVMGYTSMDNPNPSYKLGQINAFLEGKAVKPDFYLSIDEFKETIINNDKFAEMYGELGPVYGKQWVNWGGYEIISGKEVEGLNKGINQIQNAIDTLNNNPDSRRIMVSAWNVGELIDMKLPPCHWAFELYTEELTEAERGQMFRAKSMGPKLGVDIVDGKPSPPTKTKTEHYDEYNVPSRRLSLKWHQRSVDTFLGLPFNIASYGFLLEMIAQQVNMVPGVLVGDLTNVHIYKNHIEQCKEQLKRKAKPLPQLVLNKADDIFSYGLQDYQIVNYDPHPTIKGDISV